MAQQKAADAAIDDEVDDLIDELQPGAKLLKGQYTITRYLNSGGFGITYLAKDSLDRDVVIKECFPSSFCRRSKAVVAARSRAHTAELRSIVQLFVREARNLAKIIHPNIVAVHQVFEDNGTAYMAIDFIDGLDLQQIIDGEGPRLTPDQIVNITEKLLVAVGFIHDNDMLHRDISPDNVLIDKSGEPILIDFGAAREQASKSTRAMSALRVVKDGYSPQEFYIAGSEQGPWSDLYALAATLYHVISGEAPINGQARLAALAEDRPDPYTPLTGRHPGYPAGFLEAIDRAMSTLPKQRLQSAAEWLAMFGARTVRAGGDTVSAVVHRLVEASREPASESSGLVGTAPPLSRTPTQPAPMTTPVEASRGRSPVQLVAGVAAAIIVVAVGYTFLGGREDPAPDSTVLAAETAASPDAASDAATAATTEDTAPAPETAAVTAPASDPATEAAAQPAEEASPAVEPVAVAAADTIAPEPAPEPQTEAATEPSPVADTVPAPAEVASAPLAAPAGKPSADQVVFAAWDIVMPFSTSDRIVGGKPVAVITRLSPTVDPAEAGDWLAPGVMIHAVNNAPIQSADSLTVAIMNAMSVDPDGKARVVIEYTDTAGAKGTGLLTVATIRLVNLANGVGLRTTVVDGTWKTEVTGVTRTDVTNLRQGDILFRDKTTGAPLDGPTTIETILGDLVSRDMTQTEFSIVRANKVTQAVMQLSLAGGE
jgi:serine/threonine protein kinase